MKLSVKFEDENGVQIVEDANSYRIRYRTTWLFFFKGWQYILTTGYGGFVYREWNTFEEAKNWIERFGNKHIDKFENAKKDYLKGK